MPILDVKQLESKDSLSFTVVLIEELREFSYDQVVPDKKGALGAFKTFYNKKSGIEGAHFPMSFESEHVGKIIACFNKVLMMAIERHQTQASGG